ncbi:MAG: sensor histidine kinase [Hyphomicrobiaceae bacterium]
MTTPTTAEQTPDAPATTKLVEAPLIAAGRLLAERGVYSLVWFGADLVVNARYGRLTDFIEVGDYLPERCFALFGLEAEILSLRDDPRRVVELPAVAMVTSAGPLPRLNLTLFYDPQCQCFLMLMAHAVSGSAFDNELSRQMRLRLMAETEAASKSRELARSNQDLARANRDLEDFAAVISHDLKAPLRALRYASQEALALLAAGEVTGASQRLAEIEARSRRMSEMMTALLDYASVGRKADIAEPTDTRALVDRVVAAMPLPRGFEIVVGGDWPLLVTVPAALDLVLRNLIDNAIKHHDREVGHIEVTARREGPLLSIRVADDGPGIAPSQHQAILLPFRTGAAPAGDGAAKGTGMGLAFVNRTVETMGGTLTIRSNPALGRGTTFELGWPPLANALAITD